MKIKSEFFACLMVMVGFIFLAVMCFIQQHADMFAGFFIASALVFLIMLPTCSMKE